ncbi:MAG: tetratricopeptide repeat protein [bacterium]|nr:tetratricopeptide repeat protein [bacterium]
MKNLRSIWMFAAIVMLIGCGGVKANEDELFNTAKQFQEQGKQTDAVAKYEELVKIHPSGKRAPNAQFMIGFLYANELKQLDKAKTAYEKFLKDYSAVSDSGIIKSAQWELEHLGKDINDIEELKKLAPTDTTSSAPAGK